MTREDLNKKARNREERKRGGGRSWNEKNEKRGRKENGRRRRAFRSGT